MNRLFPLVLAMLMVGTGIAAPPASSTPAPGSQNAYLQSVPARISEYRRKYARDHRIERPLVRDLSYADFLAALLSEVNRKIGSGETLSEDQVRAIAAAAEAQIIASKAYVYPMWRTDTGYQGAVATRRIALYQQELRNLIAGMGRALDVYDATEKAWNDEDEASWLARFDAAVQDEPGERTGAD